LESSRKSLSKTIPLERDSIAQLRESQFRMSLVFFHRNGSEVVSLQEGDSIIVGRSYPSDIVIVDASLSRQHARFNLVEGQVHVHDLESTNGVRLNGKPCGEAVLASSDEILLGMISVSVHAPRPFETRALELDSHDHFVIALENERKRTKHFGRSVALLQVAVLGTEGVHISHFASTVLDQLRPIDRAGLYSPQILELMIPESDRDNTYAFAERVTESAKEIGLDLAVSIGIFPEHGTTGQSLLELVHNGLAHATKNAPIVVAKSVDEKSWISLDKDAQSSVIRASASMRNILGTIEKVARSAIPIMLHGETGVGKEVLAQHIHRKSDRYKKRIISINCAAIPPTLLESTLFGHEKGAFTGASSRKRGVFESADQGTVLLDEIGELPLEAQAALLRILENGVVSRVGSTEEVPVDIRIVTATHRDLEEMCISGAFREDLFFRLNIMPILIPPLRERAEDIAVLASHFLALANEKNKTTIQPLSEEVLTCLKMYRWPGNVRELKNVIDRAVVICSGQEIDLEDLPLNLQAKYPDVTMRELAESDVGRQLSRLKNNTIPKPQKPIRGGVGFRQLVRDFERETILAALHEVDGVQTHAAKILEMPIRTLVHKMKSLGIKKKKNGYEVQNDSEVLAAKE
jgi:DNA-binding NtrC family response regulator